MDRITNKKTYISQNLERLFLRLCSKNLKLKVNIALVLIIKAHKIKNNPEKILKVLKAKMQICEI